MKTLRQFIMEAYMAESDNDVHGEVTFDAGTRVSHFKRLFKKHGIEHQHHGEVYETNPMTVKYKNREHAALIYKHVARHYEDGGLEPPEHPESGASGFDKLKKHLEKGPA